MACALSGALGSLMLLGGEHDRQLAGLPGNLDALQPPPAVSRRST